MRTIYSRFVWLFIAFMSANTYAQQAYFADGYHGGIYGHYPVEWKTRFITDQLLMHPDWRIALEIEPETWDTVQARTPEDYLRFRRLAAGDQVEFTNPTYAQPYCYNISGESIIRQFQYGIRKIHKHFPEVEFVTYSAEEPCFTSCLPQVLKLFGFKYAVLKCPDTCWGGYTAAYGGERVNWIGPDGTSLPTVPRYACEALEKGSTWQTIAWRNSETYLDACRKAGIRHPVGMCFQDAGWKNGPWIGSGEKTQGHSIYVRWKDYFEKIATGKIEDDWHFSQEDMHVNLMWGSQVLQKIARQVRASENRMVAAEKMSVFAHLENGYDGDPADLDEAWRTLMLAQHHDSWIVPYNGLRGYGTWADAIKLWTDRTNVLAAGVIDQSVRSFARTKTASGHRPDYIRIFNTLGTPRTEVVNVLLADETSGSKLGVYAPTGKKIPSTTRREEGGIRLYFEAQVPSFGYTTYRIAREEKKGGTEQEATEPVVQTSEYTVENDRYRLTFDLSKGGIIKSLVAKREGNKEFAGKAGEYALGELRGFFYEEGKFRSSTETPARLTVLTDNAFEKKIKLEGEIASHPFTQIVTLSKGAEQIDFSLRIDWKHNVGIGEYKETDWRANRRAYCDDRFKLSVLFPVDLRAPRVYKDAPFDVCESKLDNTFFNSWDNIKHNVVLHWVDLAEPEGGYGLALLTDHTTSYSYGDGRPLGLTAQYSGGGLWGSDYKITGPLEMNYALVPHCDTWNRAGIFAASDCWNEPLLHAFHSEAEPTTRSFVELEGRGYQISAARLEEGKILLRLFNAEGNAEACKVTFRMPLSGVEEVDLRGETIERKKINTRSGKSEMTVSMPRFGIKTFRLDMAETERQTEKKK